MRMSAREPRHYCPGGTGMLATSVSIIVAKLWWYGVLVEYRYDMTGTESRSTEVGDPDGRKLSHFLISEKKMIHRPVLFLSHSQTSQPAPSPLLPLRTAYRPTLRDHGRNTKAPQPPKEQKARTAQQQHARKRSQTVTLPTVVRPC